MARRVVTLSLAETDLAVLDRLARAYGSRSRAVRELLRQAAGGGLQDGPAVEELRRLSREVAALRELVEKRLGPVETAHVAAGPSQTSPVEDFAPPPPAATERELDDDHEVRKVIDALLSLSRTAKG